MILLSLVEEDALTFTELITPYLPLIGTLLGGLIIGLFALWNRKRGAVETRTPDVNEIWQQQIFESRAYDTERRLRRWLEDRLYNVLKAFRGYVNRVQLGGDTNMTPFETQMYGSEIPDDLIDTQEK